MTAHCSVTLCSICYEFPFHIPISNQQNYRPEQNTVSTNDIKTYKKQVLQTYARNEAFI